MSLKNHVLKNHILKTHILKRHKLVMNHIEILYDPNYINPTPRRSGARGPYAGRFRSNPSQMHL